MKKLCVLICALLLAASGFCQKIVSLEDCRRMALENNKSVMIANENVAIANQLKKAAFTQFLPNFSLNAAYMWNQKNISMLAEDAHLPVGTVMSNGEFGFRPDQVSNQWTTVNGSPAPLDANGVPFDPKKNPEKIQWNDYALLPKEALEFDVQHIFVGSIGFTQPIYMGGKIRELNKLAKYGQNLAQINTEKVMTDLLLEVDEAYWRVVSVESKVALSVQYYHLISNVDNDMQSLIGQGFATKADALKVKVKLNEAELAMTRAQDGLHLSRMALNQLCGFPLEEEYTLAQTDASVDLPQSESIPVEEALALRPEIRSLKELEKVAHANTKLAYSRFMPTIGLSANYIMTNPNVFNGFSNKFSGMMNFGIVATMPLFHFGERSHLLKVAKSQARIAGWQIEEAEEKIELQITQSSFRVEESRKKQQVTLRHIENAEENLRLSQEGFNEGVISSTDLLAAQSAWLAAQSDHIDANIDVRLCRLYLEKAQGQITVSK